jgi:hypothetical protein
MAKNIDLQEFRLEDIPLSCTWIVVGPPSSGKCKRRGSEVLTYTGNVKKVEDIVIGDYLMGDESTARKVVKLYNGHGKMYKITPHDNSKPYYVTGNHTLCLKYNTRPRVKKEGGKYPRYRVVYGKSFFDDSKGYPLTQVRETNVNFSTTQRGDNEAKQEAEEVCELLKEKYNKESAPIHEIEVEEYLNQSKSFNHRLVAYRSNGVEFPMHFEPELDPYLIGLWLGDGSSDSSTITNIDKEIIDFLYEEADKMGMTITRGNGYKGSMSYRFISKSGKKNANIFLNFLRDENLLNNKHVPKHLKTNSREVRLALLAGLIDSDGYWANSSYYEIIQKNEQLADDILFICRSLGFWARIKPVVKGCMYKGELRSGTYHMVTFGGYGMEDMPIRCKRKMAPKCLYTKTRDYLHYKFSVEYVGIKEYFGFEVEGKNHRFLMGDFTVTRNCLAPDTPVMLFDKSVKLVQDITTDDKLMGDDFRPRDVFSICQGEDEMYEIEQSQAMNYTVNSAHILTLGRYTPREYPVLEDFRLEEIRENIDVFCGGKWKGVTLNVDYKVDVETESSVEEFNKTESSVENAVKKYSDIKIKPVGRGIYHGFTISDNGRFLLGDGTVTHNTTFMENMAYYLKHRYPIARLFIGTDAGYNHLCKIFHPLYVSNYYDEEEEKQHILRQRTCEIENGHGYEGNYAINIIDDASDDPKIYKTKVMRGLFKLGSQHWNQLLMVGSQYAIDMPPDIRKSVSYVAIFFEPEEIERKKLYTNFGGLAGSYENFCDLMNQVTGDYTCLIFKKRTQTHALEENISWFRTRELKDWKFGCKEYRSWAKDRYDTNYKEQIIM